MDNLKLNRKAKKVNKKEPAQSAGNTCIRRIKCVAVKHIFLKSHE